MIHRAKQMFRIQIAGISAQTRCAFPITCLTSHELDKFIQHFRFKEQFYRLNIKIENINGLSANAVMSDLHRWLDNFKSPPNHDFLNHGEEGSLLSLENYLQSQDGWNVTAPACLEEYAL